MLRQALGVEALSLNFTHIQSLIRNRMQESQILEYKETVPSNPEFSKDVAAMANGGGGVIILGMEDRNNLPVSIKPIGLANEVSRLEQVINSNIHPFPHVQMYEKTEHDGGMEGVIVVDVLPSGGIPHAVDEGGGRLGFYIRTGQHRSTLNEAQVSQMYRERFRRQSAIDIRLSGLVGHARLSFPASRSRIYIAAVPTTPSIRLFRPNQRTIDEVRKHRNSWPPIINDSVGETVPPRIRTNFRRLELTGVEFTTEQVNRDGWVEFYDDGAFLGMISGTKATTPDGAEEVVFHDTTLVVDFVGRLLGYWFLSRHFQFYGEVVVRAGVVVYGNPWILVSPHRQMAHVLAQEDYVSGIGQFQQRDPVFTDRVISVSDLAPDSLLLQTAKDLLDDLFTAFRWSEAPQLTEDGKFRREFFGHSLARALEPWARRNGLLFADE